MFPNLPFRGFKSTYRCYSVSMMPGQSREDVDKGGKSKRLLLLKQLFTFKLTHNHFF